MTQTHNFKVGDKVLDKSNGDVGIVIDRQDYGEVWAKWGSTGEELWFNPHNENYELVEQPKSSTTNKPHKHKDLIIAYANGAEIEYYHPTDNEWYGISNPGWYEHIQYRIKPEPKPDVIKYVFVEEKPSFCNIFNDNNLKLTFCGETGKLKSAEVIS